MPVLRDGGTDACPQCKGLACFLSLTAPPTASSYITPSPSPGPLPAFIGLFLSFSTLAFSPHWLLILPPPRLPIIHRWFVLFHSSSFYSNVDTPGVKTWMPGCMFSLQSCSCGKHLHDTARKQGSFKRTGPDRIPQTGLYINEAVSAT